MKFWRGVLALVNTWTGDWRRIEELTWRELPLTLRFQREDNGGHSNAIPCGTIDRVWFDGDNLMGEGTFSENADGEYASGVVGDQSLRGISIDPGAVTGHDVVIASDGQIIDIEEWFMYPAGAEPWPGPFTFGTIYDAYEMAAATLVATPAFATAAIELSDTPPEGVDVTVPAAGDRVAASALTVAVAISPASMVARVPGEVPTKPASLAYTRPRNAEMSDSHARLVASSAFRPPVEAYRQREFEGYERFTIDDETRFISGHIYPWEGAHRGFRATYFRPPQSRNFTEFLSGGKITLADGQRPDVGLITHFKGHLATLAEYDLAKSDPANQLGPVVLYADRFGVQACGVAWPDIDPVALARAAAAYPSGDWNWVAGEQLLTGVACVNDPGFHAFEQEGQDVVRLVASFAGAKPVDPNAPPATSRRAGLSPSALADLAALDEWERRRRAARG